MKSFRTTNPYTEETLEEFQFDSSAQLDLKISRGHLAYKKWRSVTLVKRIEHLHYLAELLGEQKERLAEQMTLEMGKPITESRAEVTKCALLCRYYVENGEAFLAETSVDTEALSSIIRYDPVGTVLGIMPWNFPLWQVFRCAVPAILSGNTFLLKHALNVMGCANLLEQLFSEAGLEDVFINVIARHEDIPALIQRREIGGVALTGSVAAGQSVAQVAGHAIKPCVLELGGSDAFIVLEDCDLDAAVEAGVFSRMLNNGQSCIAAKRFLVQASIHDTFVEKITKRVSKITLGDPSNSSTQMGPMARPDLVKTLINQTDRTISEGGNLHFCHPFRSERGFFFSPSILTDLSPEKTLFQEESFGPALAIAKIQSLREAVKISNQSSFGLGATIWTSAVPNSIISKLDVGTIAINGFVKSDPRLPFGGTKMSGYGRELAKSGIRAFTNEKVISRFQ